MICRCIPLLLVTLGLVAGCQTSSRPAVVEPLVARFYLEVRPDEAGVVLQLPVSEVAVTVGPKPVLVEYDLINAEVAQVELGPCLFLQLTPAAAHDLHRLSLAAAGRRLVLTLNGSPFGARRIDQPLADGTLLIFVEVPASRLPGLVDRLKQTTATLAAQNT